MSLRDQFDQAEVYRKDFLASGESEVGLSGHEKNKCRPIVASRGGCPSISSLPRFDPSFGIIQQQ